MKNLTNNKKVFAAVIAALIMAVFASTLYSQEPSERKANLPAIERITKSELAMKNLEMAFNSDNPGLRISAIHYIGKYQLTAFEEKLVTSLYKADTFREQRALAVSLYQMGTLSCIAALDEYSEMTDSQNMREFCTQLVSNYNKEEIAKANYLNSLAVDSEISE